MVMYELKGFFTQKWEICHNLLTSRQSKSVTFSLQWNIKEDILHLYKNTTKVNGIKTTELRKYLLLCFAENKNKMHTGSEWQEGEYIWENFHFWVDYPFNGQHIFG